MAARLNRRHQESVVQKIRTSQLINRLQDHVLGEVTLTQTQLKACEILLRKSLPDLKAVEHSGEINHQHAFADQLEAARARAVERSAEATQH